MTNKEIGGTTIKTMIEINMLSICPTAEKSFKKADQEMITPIKGEAPMEEAQMWTKGEQNSVEEVRCVC